MPHSVMFCPFCSRELTDANAVKGGRYSCPDCAKTSKEAEYGWLPRAQAPRVTVAPDDKADGLTHISRSKMFAHDVHGNPISRDSSCECGRRFSQHQLSARFMGLAEGKSQRAAQLVAAQCPGLFVPVHCPACERLDLGRQAHVDESRHYIPPFGERPDAA
jgi:hypothetical protein